MIENANLPIEQIMEIDLNELTAVLSKEERVFRDYLDLLSRQQEYLIANDLPGIKATIEKINTLAQEATNLENGRRRILGRLSELAQFAPGDLNISNLVEKFEGPKFRELEKLKDAILKIHNKIVEQKQRNELLIDQSMSMITQTMQYIHKASNPKVTYDNPAGIKGGSSAQAALISRMI